MTAPIPSSSPSHSPISTQIDEAEAQLRRWEHEWKLQRKRANIAIKVEQAASTEIRKWRERLERLRGPI